MHKCIKDLNWEEIRRNPREFFKSCILLASNIFTYTISVKKKIYPDMLYNHSQKVNTIQRYSKGIESTWHLYLC